MLGYCKVTGEVDLATAQTLSADLHDIIDHSDVELVVVDCTDLTFIDSSGFYALVEANAYAVGHDHTLVIRHMSPRCARLIYLCDWGNELHLEPAA
jgi:anti-anti-sigma factor